MDMSLGVKFAVGGGIAAVVGALLPWGVVRAPFVGQVSMSGIEGDGVFTLIFGVVVAAVSLAARTNPTRGKANAVMVLSALIAIIGVVDLSRLPQGGEMISVGSGAGLWVTILAGGAALWGGVLLHRERAGTASKPYGTQSGDRPEDG